MPRRGLDFELALHSRKRMKMMDEPPPSLDASFCDDEALPPGIIFSDIQQKKWKIGKPIGRGSFGRIYLASDTIDTEVTKANAKYVVKIEPHTNGPLFVEVHCLIRTARADEVRAWRQRNDDKRLGMPVYIASGSFTDDTTGVKYRFLVLPRYDIDLQKIIARTKVLDVKNICVLAIQILEVLEYLHEHGYTHSDIKSSNLMLGFDGNKNRPHVKTLSYQKETKEVAVLSGKHRKVKSTRPRPANYYDDEDFVMTKEQSDSEDERAGDKKLATVKRRLRKMLTDRGSRILHRHHMFNLRQLSRYVNYKDMSSSVCSDLSYQKLLDDFGNRQLIGASDDFYEDVKIGPNPSLDCKSLDQIHKEAVLSQSSGQIYLLDYGLASRFLDAEGNHKDFGMDARKAHDGTLEYSSRDSHIGAHSRRSDLETLGYNLLDWLTGTLPWKTAEVLAEPDLVHALKKNYMGNIKAFLKTCFKTDFYPQFLERYLLYMVSLDFKERPDYVYCKSIFKSELLKNGYDKDLQLNFAELSKSSMSRAMFGTKRFGKKNTPSDFLARKGIRKAYECENMRSLENDLKLELLKETLNTSSDGIRKPCTTRNFFVSDADLVARLKKSLMRHDILGKKVSPKNLRSQMKVHKMRGVPKRRNSIGEFGKFMGSARQFTWAEILAGNPENIMRKERNAPLDDDDESTCKYKIRRDSNSSDFDDSHFQSPLLQKDYLHNLNPTYAMLDVIAAFKKKVSGKCGRDTDEVDGLEGYTPAMIKVHKMREKREQRERAECQLSHKETTNTKARLTRGRKKRDTKKLEVTKSVSSSDSMGDDSSQTTEKRLRNCKRSSVDTDQPSDKTDKKRKVKKEQSNRSQKNIEGSISEEDAARSTRMSRYNSKSSKKEVKVDSNLPTQKRRSPRQNEPSRAPTPNIRRRLRSSKHIK